MIYTATITSASLRLRESRIIAGLLIEGVDAHGWNETLLVRNALQMGSEVSIKRVSGLIRARLEPLGAGLWEMVHKGSRVQATQAVMAAAIKHSRLLGDFMDIVIREQKSLFATRLERSMWTDYVAGCRGRDPEMPLWSESTVDRLRSAVFSMLAEAGYIKDTRSLILQTVFLDTDLANYLSKKGEAYVLRCLEVAQ